MIMKNIYIVLLVAIALFSCYDDKGNDDYKELEEVEVVLPDETYNRSFGEKLQITPTVTTMLLRSRLLRLFPPSLTAYSTSPTEFSVPSL